MEQQDRWFLVSLSLLHLRAHDWCCACLPATHMATPACVPAPFLYHTIPILTTHHTAELLPTLKCTACERVIEEVNKVLSRHIQRDVQWSKKLRKEYKTMVCSRVWLLALPLSMCATTIRHSHLPLRLALSCACSCAAHASMRVYSPLRTICTAKAAPTSWRNRTVPS